MIAAATQSRLWDIMMRLAISANALTCGYVTSYDGLSTELGPGNAIILLLMAAVTGAFIGPMFKRSWAANLWHLFWASLMTTILSAATTLGLHLLLTSLFYSQAVAALMTLPATMLSGAILAPLAIMSHLKGLAIWIVFTLLTGWAARKSMARAKEATDSISETQGFGTGGGKLRITLRKEPPGRQRKPQNPLSGRG